MAHGNRNSKRHLRLASNLRNAARVLEANTPARTRIVKRAALLPWLVGGPLAAPALAVGGPALVLHICLVLYSQLTALTVICSRNTRLPVCIVISLLITREVFMLTRAECREHAAQCIAWARRKPVHRSKLIKTARAWLRLAGQMDQIYGVEAEERAGSDESSITAARRQS